MIAFLVLIISLVSFGSEPLHWSYMLEVKDRHEFYQNNEEILKPKNSFQLLFSVIYVDQNFKKIKDCVFYKVPGDETGTLKIRSIPELESCDDYLFGPGDKEISAIKTLQFSITDSNLILEFTRKDYKSEKWLTKTQNSFVRPTPKLNLSSSEYKHSKITLLAPTTKVVAPKVKMLEDKTLCHDINEDCQEASRSTCYLCKQGWYEVPNGCAQGPKYCGILDCGGKDAPACRRGMKWQKNPTEFDCRTDKSFAYCSKGLEVTCEGRKAFCR